jgi:hypothetical protein
VQVKHDGPASTAPSVPYFEISVQGHLAASNDRFAWCAAHPDVGGPRDDVPSLEFSVPYFELSLFGTVRVLRGDGPHSSLKLEANS